MNRLTRVSATGWGWIILLAVLVYGVASGFSWLLFGIGPLWSAIPVDFSLHLALAFLLSGLFRRRWGFALFYTGLMLFLQFGHAAKTAVLGAPMAPDDIYSLRAFLLIIKPWQQVLLLLAALSGAFVLLYNVRITRLRQFLAAGILCGVLGGIVLAPAPLSGWLDRRFGYVDWDPAGDFRRRGALLHTVQESTRFLAHRQVPPSRAEVTAILSGRPESCPTAQPDSHRNVHVIVLESFWDAALLKTALEDDPLPEDFRRLWADAGHSHSVGPVFGGYTANAEFEALCGFPVSEPFVLFERNVNREVNCLPKVLAESGYRSVASHPNIPAFWNRHNVYRRIGFDTFWAGTDFVYDDMNGEFLSDRSLYRQVLEKIDPLLDGDKPLFNYVLTISGHLPYPLSADRPLLFESRSAYPDVANYASTLHYKARDLMEFLAVLRQRDPQGLIVMFGDHLPTLGGYGAYAESGLISAQNRAQFSPQNYLDMSSTPLVIIDGENGPVPAGDLPTFRLPALILQLLGNQSRTLLAYTETPPGLQVRPLVGMHLNLSGGVAESCKSEPLSESCRQTAEWLRQTQVLANDLFVGSQYAQPASLPAVEGAPLPAVANEAQAPQPATDSQESESAPAPKAI
ncbi:LTA synthase family protein [Trichloromonas sp.]|uniref:LTA synthase family protein n=1 Tax=Trichloromonas sp. TaxID=3069249 RepID=UPI003D81B867